MKTNRSSYVCIYMYWWIVHYTIHLPIWWSRQSSSHQWQFWLPYGEPLLLVARVNGSTETVRWRIKWLVQFYNLLKTSWPTYWHKIGDISALMVLVERQQCRCQKSTLCDSTSFLFLLLRPSSSITKSRYFGWIFGKPSIEICCHFMCYNDWLRPYKDNVPPFSREFTSFRRLQQKIIMNWQCEQVLVVGVPNSGAGLKDELFVVLVRLRLGLFLQDKRS